VRGVAGGPLLALALEFAAFLQISRLFNRRTARDHQQIAVLAFLHLIAATVLSSDLTYAAAFLGFVVVTPWMMAISHLRREIEGNYPGSTDGTSVANVRRVLASRRVVGPRFLVGTALLALPLFLMTAVLFLVFPRVGMGFLTFRRGHGVQVAGFGHDIELGRFGVIRDDPTVVVRVTVPRELTGDPPPSRIALRLRGTSFDRYDGRRWTRTPLRTEHLGRVDEEYAIVRPPRRAEDLRMRIVLEPLDEPVIFLPEGTVAIEIPPRLAGGAVLGRALALSPGLDLRYLDGDDLGLVYTAFISRDPEGDRRTTKLKDEERALYLALPTGHARVLELAQRVTRGARTDRERATRILRYLRETGRFRYTLRQPETRGRAPLEAFLFDSRAGHCEYFATAMAIMLRAVDVPTRNTTGFLGGRYNRYGDYYAVRQGDAHSWVEAYEEGRGWVTYDPTPPARGLVRDEDGMLDGVDALVDAVRTRWTTRVVGYDLQAQVGILRDLRRLIGELRGEQSTTRGLGAGTRESSTRSHELGLALVAFAVACVAFALALRYRRRRRAAAAGPESTREVVAIYAELDRALARRGRARPTSTTPREHASLLTGERFTGANAVAEITDRYLEVRYGGSSMAPGEAARLRALVRAVEQARADRSAPGSR